MTDIIQIAHRGDSKYNKDNTIESFISALNKNYDMIELDVQLCKSGEIIVFHDLEIHDKMVNELNFDEILEIENDIISLEEFFKIPGMKDSKIYIDLKGSLSLANEIVDFIHEANLNKDNIIIGSFNLKHLDIINILDSEIKLGFITENNLNDFMYCKLSQLNYLHFVCIHWTMLDHESLKLIKLLGHKIFCYTCKNDTILLKILEYDVNGIVTNYKIDESL